MAEVVKAKVIPDWDAKVAQMFTLIHEFTHALTGYSAGIGETNIENYEVYNRFKLLCKPASFFLPD